MSAAALLSATVAAAALALLAAAPARAADGRALYRGEVAFSPGTTGLPAPFNACARCHGAGGEGGREGALEVPPVTWAALAAPREGRPGFPDEAAVLGAIRHGRGRDGAALSAAMPRFDLGEAEAGALLAFLHRLGTADDRPPGVEAETIALGTLLPLSGRAGATGRAVLAGLTDSFDAANGRGGVFGRRLRLSAADTGPAGAEAALRALTGRPLLAVVGGLWPERATLDRMLADRHLSIVAPLVPAEGPAPAQGWTVELLPDRASQDAALARALADCPAAARWALRQAAPDPPGAGGPIRWFDGPTPLREALKGAPPDGCLGLDLAATATLGPDIPAAWGRRVVLPVPAALLQEPEPWRRLGRLAGQLAIELLSASGERLHERSMVEAAGRLGDVAALHLAALRFEAGRFRGWDAEVITVAPRPGNPGASAAAQ